MQNAPFRPTKRLPFRASRFPAHRSSIHPRFDERARFLLRAGRWFTAGSGHPRPADQTVLANMFNEALQRSVAVARRILDLGADLADRLAFPSHLARREMPDRVARHPPGLEVCCLMANRTSHRRQAEAVGAPFDRRLMKSRRVALARAVASGVAIETAGAGQHLAELSKISGRPRSRIADRRKALDAGECLKRRRKQRRRSIRSPAAPRLRRRAWSAGQSA